MKNFIVLFLLVLATTITPKVYAGSAWIKKLQTSMMEQGWLIFSAHPGYTRCAIEKPNQTQENSLVALICDEYGHNYKSRDECRLAVLDVVRNYANISCIENDLEVKTLEDGTKLAFIKGEGWFEDEFIALGKDKGIIKDKNNSYCKNKEPDEVDIYAFNKICPTNENTFARLCNEEKQKFLSFENISLCSEIQEEMTSQPQTTPEQNSNILSKIVTAVVRFLNNLFRQ